MLPRRPLLLSAMLALNASGLGASPQAGDDPGAFLQTQRADVVCADLDGDGWDELVQTEAGSRGQSLTVRSLGPLGCALAHSEPVGPAQLLGAGRASGATELLLARGCALEVWRAQDSALSKATEWVLPGPPVAATAGAFRRGKGREIAVACAEAGGAQNHESVFLLGDSGEGGLMGRPLTGLSLRHMAACDADGDGQAELACVVCQRAKLDPVRRLRVHLYQFRPDRGGWWPFWQGSSLSRPFRAVRFARSRAGLTSGDRLVSLERSSVPDEAGRDWLVVYRWNGFGFSVEWQALLGGAATELFVRDLQGDGVDELAVVFARAGERRAICFERRGAAYAIRDRGIIGQATDKVMAVYSAGEEYGLVLAGQQPRLWVLGRAKPAGESAPKGDD